MKDLLGNSDWNVLPNISRISAEKYLEKGFSLQLAGSLNKISTFTSKDDSDFLYYSLGVNVKYDVNNLIGDTSQYFDPFVYLGGDFVSADSNSEGMLNIGVGFNTWFNENLGLSFQTGTKKSFSSEVQSHYQSSLGIVIKFGGTDTDSINKNL
jgi:OOP family OmpA-OmpF porin